MVGKGAEVFAVMGYVIANMVPDRTAPGRMVVELNPRLLAFIIGEKEETIESAIEVLCSPDPESRSKEEDGRRLIRTGQYEFHVVNGWKYRARRDPEKRREQNREAQARYRAKRQKRSRLGGESYVRAEESGASSEQLDRLAAEGAGE